MPEPHSNDPGEPRVQIESDLLLELHRAGRGHSGRLLTFIGLYLVATWSAWQLAETLPWGQWTYALLAPLVLLAAVSLHGISLFTHEGVHDTLSSSRIWNRVLSILCALP